MNRYAAVTLAAVLSFAGITQAAILPVTQGLQVWLDAGNIDGADSNLSGDGPLLSTRRGESGWTLRSRGQDTSMYFINTGDAGSMATNLLDSVGFNLIESVRDAAGGPASIRLSDNGGAPATAIHTPANYTPAQGGTGLGGRPDSSSLWGSDIAEIIVYDRVLTTHESNVVGGYLTRKYGLLSDYVLDVDFGAAGSVGTQSGFDGFEFSATPSPVTRSFTSRLGSDGSVEVGLSVASTDPGLTSLKIDTRDRGSITGSFGFESNLLGDFVFPNATPNGKGLETLALTLDDLTSGLYEITLFHHDRDNHVGKIDVLLDDAAGSDQLIYAGLEQSTGASPVAITTSTFRFFADGIAPVVIRLREVDDTAGSAGNEIAVLNGFMLTAVVPEPGTWTLALLGMAATGLLPGLKAIGRRRTFFGTAISRFQGIEGNCR